MSVHHASSARLTERPEAFIVAKLARPGDVIVVGSKDATWQTWGLRIFSFSRFTHASVMVTRLGFLETNGPGRCAQITVARVYTDLDGSLLLACGGHWAKLRRPSRARLALRGIKEPARAAFGKEVSAGVLLYLGREYADLVDLTRASPLLRWLWRRPPLKTNPFERWFCSSLVAQAYEDAGLSLGPAAHVSPGRLARSRDLDTIAAAVVMRRRSDLRPVSRPAPLPSAIMGAMGSTWLRTWWALAGARARTVGAASAARQASPLFTQVLSRPVGALRLLWRWEAALRAAGQL